MQSKVVVWDFDGTLAWRDGMWSGALAQSVKEIHGATSLTADDFRPYLQSGFPWHDPSVFHGPRASDEWWGSLARVFRDAYLAVGFEETEARDLASAVKDIFLSTESWRVFEDVQESLSALKDCGWKHIILSNHVPELAELVAGLSLHGYFDAVLSSAQIGFEKPHKSAFDALTEFVPQGADVVMVGDSYEADVLGAQAAGIQAILVRRPNPEAEYYSENLDGLTDMIEDLLEQR